MTGTDWTAAVQPSRGGLAIDVEVAPGAAEDRFPAGYNPWRKRLLARVHAPAADGRANDALRELVGAFLGVPAGRVEILNGHTSRLKRLWVSTSDAEADLRRIQEALDGF